MWVIKSRLKNNYFLYDVGYFYIDISGLNQFECFETCLTSEDAIALCSRLNGGQ